MKRLLATFSVASLISISVATACGSSDKSVTARGGGEGGDAGATPIEQGGSSTAPRPGGAAGESSQGTAGQPLGEGGATGGAGSGDGGTETTAGGADATGGVGDSGGAGGLGDSGGAGGLGDSGGAGGAGGASAETVVDLGFDGSDSLPSNVDAGTATLTPSQGFAELGPAGNKFGTTFLRGPTGTIIKLTLTDLPRHTSLSLSMLFAAIDSLDGTGTFPAGDFFKITVDDVLVFRESFANALESQIQSYNPPAAAVLARHVDLGFSGPGSFYTDSAYDFGQDPALQNLPHSASSATLVFTLEGEGVQDINDESWALDNLRVTVH
jgi:hypothetical protein